ncbi:unnamed protein product, partial [Mesorhabditis spiculigera]
MQSTDSNKVQGINCGGKAILPPSVLDHIMQMDNQSPVMLFKVMNIKPERQKATHCGVLEFSAEEGRCYLPARSMRAMLFVSTRPFCPRLPMPS